MVASKLQLSEDQLQKFMVEEVDRLIHKGYAADKAVDLVLMAQYLEGHGEAIVRTVGKIGLYKLWKEENATRREEAINPVPDVPQILMDPIRSSTPYPAPSVVGDRAEPTASPWHEDMLRFPSAGEQRIAAPPERDILDTLWKIGSTWVPLRFMTGANCKSLEDFYAGQEAGMARKKQAFRNLRKELPSDRVSVGDHLGAQRLREIFQGVPLSWSQAS